MADTLHASGVTSQGTLVHDNLIAGEEHLLTRKVTLITGQNVVRGALLGRITASGKYNLSLSAAADGSQTPRGIAAMDVDATAADKDIIVYEKGDFNELALTIGTAHTIATVRDGLQDLGIFLRKNLGA